ncbi:MAG: tetratricopeptide repeat protein [Flammeovirgaceae bacterium]|nr:tetratricopeptide repeat protein [Flammeovirgaceae bacterium]
MLGQYNEAEQLFDQALPILLSAVGESGMQYAIVSNNKAMLYQAMGRYDEAIPLLKNAITALEVSNKRTLKGKKSFDSRKFNSNLALLYQLSGDLAQSETAFWQ